MRFLSGPGQASAKARSHPSSTVAVGVAVRDPNIREVLLALIRLNRMRVRGIGSPPPEIEIGPPATGVSLLVGYISSPADADYFDTALREDGDPPSVALVPRDADPRLVRSVERRATRVVRVPDQGQTIVEAIRAQLAAGSRSVQRPKPASSTRLGRAA